MTHEEVIAELNKLIQCEGRVNDPVDEITQIFEKIAAWKAKAGGSED